MSQPANARKKPEPAPAPMPEFNRLNLLSVGMVVALFTTRAQYKTAMHEIGIREENWHAWPDPGCAWVYTYVDGERARGKHVVVCMGDTAGLDGIDIASVLCHEAVHVWQAYCSHISERYPADEQSAYAIQAISEFLMREFVRLNRLGS